MHIRRPERSEPRGGSGGWPPSKKARAKRAAGGQGEGGERRPYGVNIAPVINY
jgi:hypothetical protein